MQTMTTGRVNLLTKQLVHVLGCREDSFPGQRGVKTV